VFGRFEAANDGCDGYGLHCAKTLHPRQGRGDPGPVRIEFIAIAPEWE